MLLWSSLGELKKLSQFLSHHCDCSLEELHGFLTAVISGPSLIRPSEWMEVMGISEIDFISEEEANEILTHIMAFYNTIAKQLEQQIYKPLATLNQLGTLNTEEVILSVPTPGGRGKHRKRTVINLKLSAI